MTPSPSGPNVLLICTDQQRWNALGAAGNPEIETPHLDRLAASGARFTHCVVQSPVCAPSRASLMTGCYPQDHGLWANGVALPTETRLLPEAVAEAGYDCGLVGKWHLEPCDGGRTETPARGFRVWQWAHDPYPGSPENAYHRWLAETRPELFARLDEPGFSIDRVPTAAHYSHWVADRAIDFLRAERPAGQPFFLVANFFDPHHPFGAPAEYRDRYNAARLAPPVGRPGELDDKPSILTEASLRSYAGHAPGFADYTPEQLADLRADYYAMVSLVDDEVGRILSVLDDQGLTGETVVVFTSDHGEMLGDHQLLLKGPMLYDAAVRVPLLVSWPGRIGAGTVVDELVQWIDLTATLTELTGASLPRQQGVSLLGPATGTGGTFRGWALCSYRNSGHPYDPPVHLTMVRTPTAKIVLHHGRPATDRGREGELYDLQDDPDELVNRWDDPARAGLRRELTELALDVLVAAENRSQPRAADW